METNEFRYFFSRMPRRSVAPYTSSTVFDSKTYHFIHFPDNVRLLPMEKLVVALLVCGYMCPHIPTSQSGTTPLIGTLLDDCLALECVRRK